MAKQNAGGNVPAPDTAEAGNTPPAQTPKAYRYRCREACTFMKRYWGEGEVAVLSEKTANPHFEPVE
jgi:hypothetical protein